MADAASGVPCHRRRSVPYQQAIDGVNSAVAVGLTFGVPDKIPGVTLPRRRQDEVCVKTRVAFVDDELAENDVPFLYLFIFKHWIVHATVAASHSRPYQMTGNMLVPSAAVFP